MTRARLFCDLIATWKKRKDARAVRAVALLRGQSRG